MKDQKTHGWGIPPKSSHLCPRGVLTLFSGASCLPNPRPRRRRSREVISGRGTGRTGRAGPIQIARGLAHPLLLGRSQQSQARRERGLSQLPNLRARSACRLLTPCSQAAGLLCCAGSGRAGLQQRHQEGEGHSSDLLRLKILWQTYMRLALQFHPDKYKGKEPKGTAAALL